MRPTSATLQALGGEAYGWRLLTLERLKREPHFGEPPVRANGTPVTVRSELGGAGMQIRFGQVLTRTNSTLSAVRLVRNLADRHPDPAQFRNTSLI